jgi:hypothetical protein
MPDVMNDLSYGPDVSGRASIQDLRVEAAQPGLISAHGRRYDGRRLTVVDGGPLRVVGIAVMECEVPDQAVSIRPE